MPFGGLNYSSTYSGVIHLVRLSFNICCTYINDNQLYDRSYLEHLKHLKLTPDRTIQVNMKFNPNKCVLFGQKLEFLGFEVSTEGISPIKAKIDTILLAAVLTDKSGLIRGFISMVGFYRRHIHQFAQRTIELTNLLKRNVLFIWEPKHQREFEDLKDAISNAAILNYPDHEKL